MAGGTALRVAVTLALLSLAAAGWWWSALMAGGAAMSIGSFTFAWLAMMTAMMFPAVAPVVMLYARAASRGRVAPLPFFVAGYLAVWTSIGLLAYPAWRALLVPIEQARPWAGRVAGVVLLAAAVWQLTPLKSMCLRHCRSPLSFFLRCGAGVTRPGGAMRMGVAHGVFCLGCCWVLMAILVAVGTMHRGWMAALALLILIEKDAPGGEQVARLAAAGFAVVGAGLLAHPELLGSLT